VALDASRSGLTRRSFVFTAAATNVPIMLATKMLAVSAPLLHKSPLDVLAQAVPAGFIIASVAWIRAAITNGEFWVVLTLTYVIALGEFTHVKPGWIFLVRRRCILRLLRFAGRPLNDRQGAVAAAVVGQEDNHLACCLDRLAVRAGVLNA
jgi:hypothetical protein